MFANAGIGNICTSFVCLFVLKVPMGIKQYCGELMMCLAQGHNTVPHVGDPTQDLSIRAPCSTTRLLCSFAWELWTIAQKAGVCQFLVQQMLVKVDISQVWQCWSGKCLPMLVQQMSDHSTDIVHTIVHVHCAINTMKDK